MLNSMETEPQQSVQQQQQFPQEFMNEKMAINAIQKSLMQCETAVKGPTYSTQVCLFPIPTFRSSLNLVQAKEVKILIWSANFEQFKRGHYFL